jgi:H+-translocating NAD(P) transhydrogenase subunit beta
MMESAILQLSYLIGSITFIMGLKMLSHPDTARKGNLVAAAGMTIAIFTTIFLYENPETHTRLHNYGWIFGGLLLGTIVGTIRARKVQMTAMPELVSLFNGMGGACAMLISLIEYNKPEPMDTGKLVVIVLGMMIGFLCR